MADGREIVLPVSSARRLLVGLGAGFSLAGLAAELARHLGGVHGPFVGLLSLSYEGNLPSWYASALPLACAGLLAWTAAGEQQDRGHWRVLALGFVAIAVDEAVGFHEQLSGIFDTSGVLHFDWVIPAGALVLALGLYFLGFLRRLSRETARRFVLAGAVYVGGAVLCELPLGWWTEQSRRRQPRLRPHRLVRGDARGRRPDPVRPRFARPPGRPAAANLTPRAGAPTR